MAFSVHPGIIKSNLQSHDASFLGMLTRTAVKIAPTSTPLDGARTSLFCATSPRAISSAGLYLIPFGKVDPRANRWLNDDEAVEKLWQLASSQLKKHGFAIEDLPKYSV